MHAWDMDKGVDMGTLKSEMADGKYEASSGSIKLRFIGFTLSV